MERDTLEQMLTARMSLEQIALAVDRDPSTVGYWVKKHGLTAVHRDKHAPKGGLSRERLEAAIATSSRAWEASAAPSAGPSGSRLAAGG
jgi:hypothetical protein